MNCGTTYDCDRHELKAEIDRLRAELADRERRLEVITRALETSCANVTNRDARIAELADLVTIHQHSCKLAIARAERAEAELKAIGALK